jgi:M6 family metalloprotease-like protein
MLKILTMLIITLFISGCTNNNSDTNDVLDTGSLNNNKILVILVNFKDVKIESEVSYWDNIFFKKDLLNYMKENTNNNFYYSMINDTQGINDGIVSVTVDINHPSPTSSSDASMVDILPVALKRASAYIDMYKLDTNRDMKLDTNEIIPVFIIAGYEAAIKGYGDFPSIWAHAWYIKYIANVVESGYEYIGKYALFGEKHTNNFATVGIIAHELGHAAFNIPDLYDTTGNNNGIGAFGLMGYGSWNSQTFSNGYYASGNSPAHMSAWSKIKSGFAEPIVITENKEYTLNKNTISEYNIFKINLSNNEYLLLENMAIDGYERGKNSLINNYQGGISIWHVDDNVIDTYTRTNNVQQNTTHKGLDLLEASNNNLDDKSGYGDGLNLFYKSNVFLINNDTTPSSKDYYGTINNVSIEIKDEIKDSMQISIKIK